MSHGSVQNINNKMISGIIEIFNPVMTNFSITKKPFNQYTNQLADIYMGHSIQEWTKQNLWKTVLEKSKVIWSA